MQIFSDILGFIKMLSITDVIFFFAVLALMLLIITLIYFIKDNSTEVNDSNNDKGGHIENIKTANMSDELKKITEELNDIKDEKLIPINLNEYEKDQEQRAIISYEELINKKKDYTLNYIEEEKIDDTLNIKKIDLNNLIKEGDEKIVKPEIKVEIISYQKEEDFLKALKTLQEKLN